MLALLSKTLRDSVFNLETKRLARLGRGEIICRTQINFLPQETFLRETVLDFEKCLHTAVWTIQKEKRTTATRGQ